MEQWKDIKEYEGIYQISDKGNVRSLMKWEVQKRNYVHCTKLLNPTDNGNGYLIISLSKKRKRKNFYIHRLVAEHFVPNTNDKNKVVNHLDFDKRNNKASNLEWCTQKENVLYSRDRMCKPKNKTNTNTGEKYISYKKSKSRYEVTVSRKFIGTFKTLKEAVARRDNYLKEVMPNA